MNNLLNYQITVREILEFFFLNGVFFTLLWALISRFKKSWAVTLTKAAIKHYTKQLFEAEQNLKQSKISLEGFEKNMFILSLVVLTLDLVLKAV